MPVHRKVTPSINFAGTHLYTWVERGTVRVKCLAQEHNTMSPARTRTRATGSGVERTNHEEQHLRETLCDFRDLKQGCRRRRLKERCLKILFLVTVIIRVARLGKCEYTFRELKIKWEGCEYLERKLKIHRQVLSSSTWLQMWQEPMTRISLSQPLRVSFYF